MSGRSTISRSLNDLGLAAWFGGSLAGAVGFNGSPADVTDPRQRLEVANSAWNRWAPVNLGAIAAHLVGAAGLTWSNKGRVLTQRGVGANAVAKAVLTGAALGATAYSRVLGKKLDAAGHVPVDSATTPAATTPVRISSVQQQLKVAQWVIPALTATVGVLNAAHGEQQRPAQVLSGVRQPGRIFKAAA